MVLLLIMIMLTLAILRILMIRKRKLMIMEKTRILTRRLNMMRIRKLVEVKPSVVETSLCAASQTWRLRWECRKYSKIFGKSVGVAQI